MSVKKSFLLFSQFIFIGLTCMMLMSCSGNKNIKNDRKSSSVVMEQKFDLVLHAEKDNQFDLDGATLAPEDLRGHLRYLQEENRPVKQALLKRGEKTKIKKGHLANLAVIAKELNFQAFYEEKGEIKAIILED